MSLTSFRIASGVEVDYFSRGKPAAKWRKVPKDLYNTIRLGVQTSEDGRKWSKWHVQGARGRGSNGEPFAFTANFAARCRYLRVKAGKGGSRCERLRTDLALQFAADTKKSGRHTGFSLLFT